MKGDSLVIDELSCNPDSASVSYEESSEEKVTVCLNCGTEVSDNFCPHCGQSTSVPKKLNSKTFGKSVAMSFTRLNPGFFNTFVKLTYKPWEVVRDYIHGKQVEYSHPISMLIQIALYFSFIIMFVEGIFDIDLLKDSEQSEEGVNWFIKTLKESTVLRSIWIAIPFIVAVVLAYWNHGSRRFTFPEYIVAGLYINISINIYSFLLLPINYFWFDGESMSDFRLFTIVCLYLIFGCVMVFKAFPMSSRWKDGAFFLWFIALAVVLFVIYTMFFSFLNALISGNDMNDWVSNYFKD